jgi:D-methionine transport system ATP-binding protein
MFRVENLTHIIGHHVVLNDINFEIPATSILGIIGKSGAGKTTILRALNLIERPTKGRIFVDRQDICTMSPPELNKMRKKIGVVSQNYALLSRKTVYENVALPLSIHNEFNEESHNHIQNILSLVGMIHKSHQYPSELSGGQKQRVAIARAIIQNPSVLLCDEFTSALDPKTTLDIIHLLKSLNEKMGLTIVFVTHDINVIKELATHVVVVEHGQLVEKGRVGHIFSKPHHPTTKSFIENLTSVNLPDYLNISDTASDGAEILLKLVFSSKSANKPIMANMIKEYNIMINVIAGNLDHIGPEQFGNLVVSLPQSIDESEVFSFFLRHNVSATKLGYISWN